MTTSSSIMILTSDAGSGHRSAAAAIEQQVRGFAKTIVVNPAHHPLASRTLERAERFYLQMVNRSPEQYAFAHGLTDAPGLDLFLEYSLAGTIRRSLASLVATHQPSVVVSVYPLLTRIISRTFKPWQLPKLMTVVTDLGNVHRAWFNVHDDCVAVPSIIVRDKAIKCGIDVQRVVHTGLPINPSFGYARATQAVLRRQLGWDESLPTLLLLSGGAGIGPVVEMARALDAATTNHQLVIVAGRNQALAQALRAHHWQHLTHIYDFVALPDLVHASDVVASKAGGLTVSECMAAGKPMLFYGEAPGQEEGNRTYAIHAGAGLHASDADQFVTYATMLLTRRAMRESMGLAARHLGIPDAAVAVAHEVHRLYNQAPIVAQRSLWTRTTWR
ncbi:MAG: galactosyldiacylglycerol synthase [Chloroflexia bacterium]|nr:galactosyldiacylglycerol synthase [Chloroflexia bacterium]